MNSPTPDPEKEEMCKAFEEACALRDEIFEELERISEKTDPDEKWELHDRLSDEIFSPTGKERNHLLKYVVYHGLMGSSPNFEGDETEIDLPGDESLMAFCRKKLEGLKLM